MISAGEASGDIHAASVVEALRNRCPDLDAFGMGSQKLQDAGVELVVDFSDVAVMGYVEVLLNYTTLRNRLKQLRIAMRERKPDALLIVDYATFNLKLADTAKELGIPVLFFIGPKIWASRPGRIKHIERVVTYMALILPFEEPLYQQANMPATYVGNPLIEQINPPESVKAARRDLSAYLPPGFLPEQHTDTRVIGLLPGSRQAELKYNLPVLLETARELSNTRGELCQFLLPVAPTLSKQTVTEHTSQYPELNLQLIDGNAHTVMRACDALAIASGTATLEAAIVGTPSVSLYKMHPLNYQIMRRLITSRFITLVNIQADTPVIQEFIQSDATAENLSNEIARILDDSSYRQTMLNAFDKIVNSLTTPLVQLTSGGVKVNPSQGQVTAAANVATLVLSLFEQPREHKPVRGG